MSDKKLGQQFIQAYYSTTLQDKDELIKFYDEEATFWRDSFGNGETKQVKDNKDKIALVIQPGSELVITNFADINFKGGIHVSVNGHIINDQNTVIFNQTFVLLQEADRLFIVSDVLKVTNQFEVIDTKTETFTYNLNKVNREKQQKKPSRKEDNANKFLPFKPSNSN